MIVWCGLCLILGFFAGALFGLVSYERWLTKPKAPVVKVELVASKCPPASIHFRRIGAQVHLCGGPKTEPWTAERTRVTCKACLRNT